METGDTLAKYEVYVPDGKGDMNLQLLTLEELKTLLARQSTIQRRYQADALLNPWINDKVRTILYFHKSQFSIIIATIYIGSTELDRNHCPFFLDKAFT